MGARDEAENEHVSLEEIINRQRNESASQRKNSYRGNSQRFNSYSYQNTPYARYPRNSYGRNYPNYGNGLGNNRNCCFGDCQHFNNAWGPCQCLQMPAHSCRGYFPHGNGPWGGGNNFAANESFHGNHFGMNGGLKRSQSCESLASNRSAISCRSNMSYRSNMSNRSNMSSRSQRSNWSHYSNGTNAGRNHRPFWKRFNRDVRRCPLDRWIQTQIQGIQEKFLERAEKSPMLKLNSDPHNCKPTQTATSLTLHNRFNSYYKSIHEK